MGVCNWWTIIISIYVSSLALRVQMMKNNNKIIFDVIEESPVGTLIGNLYHEIRRYYPLYLSLGGGSMDKLNFLLMENNVYINFDSDSGNLTVRSRIDRESLCVQENTCCPTQGVCKLQTLFIDPIRSEFLDLVMSIKDLNDNAPQWSEPNLSMEIAEHTPVGKKLQLKQALDPDEPPINTTNYYGIAYQSTPGMFRLDQESLPNRFNFEQKQFNVWLVVNADLDREFSDSYQVRLFAMDGGVPSKTGYVTINITILDINDQLPVFSKVTETITVPENTPVGTKIFQVTATDRDLNATQRLTYRFGNSVSQKATHCFQIDESSGRVLVRSSLDYESKPNVFRLPIEAFDGKHVAECILTVHLENINDNPPEILLQSHLKSAATGPIHVMENKPPGYLLATVFVRDKDVDENSNEETRNSYQKVSFSKVQPRCQLGEWETFEIQPLYEKEKYRFKILTKRSLDREVQSFYNVTLDCWDGGDPPLHASKNILIYLEDENDCVPTFSRSLYEAHIDEGAPVETRVIQVRANDRDEDGKQKVYYRLESYSFQNYFSIHPLDGTISSLQVLNRELIDQINITVLAFDKDPNLFNTFSDSPDSRINTGTAVVVVQVKDKNDETPRFDRNSYEFLVRENERVMHYVGQVHAVDDDATDDNNKIRYFMMTSSQNSQILPSVAFSQAENYFRVGPDGKLFTKNNTIDRERIALFVFDIVAIDSGNPPLSSSANILIRVQDMNDNKPQWKFPIKGYHSINISLHETVGHKIAELKAEDTDIDEAGQIVYDIIRGNERGMFTLAPHQGFIYLAKSLQREHLQQVFKLFLVAKDQGQPSLESHSYLDIYVTNQMSPTQRHLPKVSATQRDVIVVVVMFMATLTIATCFVMAIVFLRCVRCRRGKLVFLTSKRVENPDGRSTPGLSEACSGIETFPMPHSFLLQTTAFNSSPNSPNTEKTKMTTHHSNTSPSSSGLCSQSTYPTSVYYTLHPSNTDKSMTLPHATDQRKAIKEMEQFTELGSSSEPEDGTSSQSDRMPQVHYYSIKDSGTLNNNRTLTMTTRLPSSSSDSTRKLLQFSPAFSPVGNGHSRQIQTMDRKCENCPKFVQNSHSVGAKNSKDPSFSVMDEKLGRWGTTLFGSKYGLSKSQNKHSDRRITHSPNECKSDEMLMSDVDRSYTPLCLSPPAAELQNRPPPLYNVYDGSNPPNFPILHSQQPSQVSLDHNSSGSLTSSPTNEMALRMSGLSKSNEAQSSEPRRIRSPHNIYSNQPTSFV